MKKENGASSPAKAGVHDEYYTFIKEEGRWYLDLPDFESRGWTKADLELISGTRRLLNSIASGKKTLTIRMATEPFLGADLLELVELCEAPKGGAIYLMRTCNGQELNVNMWLCDITLLVFGDMPAELYVQRLDLTDLTP
jgi:hypothetical protein